MNLKAMSRPLTLSWNTPFMHSAAESESAAGTFGNSDLPAMAISATIQNGDAERDVDDRCREGKTNQRTDDRTRRCKNRQRQGEPEVCQTVAEQVRPGGQRAGEGNEQPWPLTKSRWKGKNPPTIGTNSTPPPTPAGTAVTIPNRKHTKKRLSGQVHAQDNLQ